MTPIYDIIPQAAHDFNINNDMKIIDLLEASYPGNIGAMEMFKFHQVANLAQKAKMKQFLKAGKHAEAWSFLQRVLGVTLR